MRRFITMAIVMILGVVINAHKFPCLMISQNEGDERMIDKKEKAEYMSFFESFMKRILRDEMLKVKLSFDLQKLMKEVYFGNVMNDDFYNKIIELYRTYTDKDDEISKEKEKIKKLEENIQELNESIDRISVIQDLKARKVRISITLRSDVYETLKKFAKSNKSSISKVLEYVVLSSPSYKAMTLTIDGQ